MKRYLIPFLATLAICANTSRLPGAEVSSPDRDEQIKRGRYLAMGVAMCVDCHSPKLSSGQLDPERILTGTAITVTPLEPVPDWVEYAPAIAGLPAHSDEEVIEVLTTGMIGSSYLRPPMPVYQLHEEDAAAIVAYLRSLAPAEEGP